MQVKFLIIIGICIVIAVIASVAIVSPSINDFDDFVYQLKEPFDGAESEEIGVSLPSDHPIVAYNGKQCSPLELLNKTCFTAAFTSCANAKISKTITTIEGDPITTFALINSTNPDMCKIDVYRNTLQDRYGKQTVDHYSCSLIIDSGDSLEIGKCLPLEHDQPQRFVFE